MVPPLEESEDGNRASFSRWEKRSVISYHFTELVLEITGMEILQENIVALAEEYCYIWLSFFITNISDCLEDRQ